MQESIAARRARVEAGFSRDGFLEIPSSFAARVLLLKQICELEWAS
jgi:hypothetical protein